MMQLSVLKQRFLLLLFLGCLAAFLLTAMPVQKYFSSDIKMMMLFFVWIAGIFSFKLSDWLFRSKVVALLSSVAYMLSPYLLINLATRDNLNEIVAISLLPVVLFYALKCFKEPTPSLVFCSLIAWGALGMSHWVIFVCTSFFLGTFLVGLTGCDRSQWKHFVLAECINVFACISSLWYGGSVATTQPNLSSANPVSCITYAGWPALLSVSFLAFLILRKKAMYTRASKKSIAILIALFALALLFTPFSHVLLSQTLWIGSLLFGFALLELFRGKLDYRHIIICFTLIGLSSSLYL